MRLIKLVAFAVASLAIASPASAFHPFDETYGYVPPKKWQKKSEPADSGSLFAPQPKSAKSQQGKISKKFAKGPKTMSGGGRPSVSAVAPPTVSFPNSYGAGTIVIDTAGRRLYYVTSSSSAYRYPIAVGRMGFTWTGTQTISRQVNWPDWRPPAEMLQRKPELPEFMEGGVRNPLGAKALYLGNTLYRIHGTNDAKTIGTAASSGCFRMTNGHVTHLAKMAGVGTKVVVKSKLPSRMAKAAGTDS